MDDNLIRNLKNVDPESLYDTLERIGRGTFGEVFKALERRTRKVVAIKRINLEEAVDSLEDTKLEINILSQCDSPHITRYYASYIRGSQLWIVMEYLGGGSALEIRRSGKIDEPYIAIILRQVLKGLEYLHSQGKLHRDIKAANILLSERGDVKLADFGVAGQLTRTIKKRQTFVGTPFWMAPEVIKASEYDYKADIWSLGITAMELADGVPPYSNQHPMWALLSIPKNPPPQLSEKYSLPFRDFVQCCLVKAPDNRASAHELLRHSFVKKARKPSFLVELIDRYRRWLEDGDSHEDTDDAYEEETRDEAQNRVGGSFDTIKWNFDTVQMPLPPSQQPQKTLNSPAPRHELVVAKNAQPSLQPPNRLNTTNEICPTSGIVPIQSHTKMVPTVSAVSVRSPEENSTLAHERHSTRASAIFFHTHVLPLLTDLQSVYANVSDHQIMCIDSLIRTFENTDASLPNFTKDFILSLIQRIFLCDSRISPEKRNRALVRIKSKFS